MDVDEFDAAAAPGGAVAAAPVERGLAQLQTSPSSAPPKPNRKKLILGTVGGAVVVGVLAIALGSGSPNKRRVDASNSASASNLVESRSAAPLAASAPTAAMAQPTPQATPEPAAASAAPPPASATEAVEEDVKIMINVKPDGSVLLYKGKVVGRTPFILKQPRGEKRVYEIAKPGYTTRRVVLTGTEHSIGFELGSDTPHPDSL